MGGRNFWAILFYGFSRVCWIWDGYLTIRPAARKGWSIDQWPLGVMDLIILVSPNSSNRKSNNKVSKCKLKKDLFGNNTKEFRYSMTIANSPLVA